MNQKEKVLEARKKLKERFGQSSKLGGKGTQRRKMKHKPKKNTNDDKNIVTLRNKLGAQPLPEIQNMNLFTNDNKVIQFENPNVYGSFQNRTIILSGKSETKDLKDCFADVISELSPQQLEQLKKDNIIKDEPKKEDQPKQEEKKEEKPELVNFEDEANK